MSSARKFAVWFWIAAPRIARLAMTVFFAF
jgi:hypothetical protein